MKKLGILLISFVTAVILLSSCAAQHKCDAYSSTHRDKVEKVNY
ncbi:MAG: hypothetical protein ACOYO1_03140 [Bacteroidales bacterium]